MNSPDIAINKKINTSNKKPKKRRNMNICTKLKKNNILDNNKKFETKNNMVFLSKEKINDFDNKINLLSYKLENTEVQCLKSLKIFNYIGNIDEDCLKKKSLYDSSFFTYNYFR